MSYPASQLILPRPSLAQGFARSRGESAYPGLWDGLVVHYEPALGPTGGTLYDLAGRRINGALTNMDPATDWVVSQRGWVLDYDGSNDHVACGDVPVLDSSPTYTFAGWFRRAATNGVVGFGRWISAGFNDYCDLYTSGANIYAEVNRAGTSGYVSAAAINDTNWHHYVVVYDGGKINAERLSLFQDGKKLAPTTTGTLPTLSPNTDFFTIGLVQKTIYSTGQIGSVSAWSRALVDVEAMSLFVASPLTLKPRRVGKSAGGASGEISASGTIDISGDANLSGVGGIQASGDIIISGDAIVSGLGSIIGDGSISLNGEAIMSGVGGIIADGTIAINGESVIGGIGGITADGSINIVGDAILDGVSELSASGTIAIDGTASLSGVGGMVAAGGISINGTAILSGTALFSAAGTINIDGTASFFQVIPPNPPSRTLGNIQCTTGARMSREGGGTRATAVLPCSPVRAVRSN